MSESSGARDPSTLVLRISVPAGADYEAIVKELAAKVATYLGDTDQDGAAAAAALEQVATSLAGGAGASRDDDTVFEFRQAEGALLIHGRASGRSAKARRALPFRA
jgi:hypothetical protein